MEALVIYCPHCGASAWPDPGPDGGPLNNCLMCGEISNIDELSVKAHLEMVKQHNKEKHHGFAT